MFVLPGSVVENSQHGDEPVAVPVGPSDIGATGADTVDIETDPPSRLGDQSALLESIINTFEKTINFPLYTFKNIRLPSILSLAMVRRKQELSWGLGVGVKQGGGGVGEQLLGQEIVRLDGGVDVLAMDPDRYPHEHLLGPLHNLAVLLE